MAMTCENSFGAQLGHGRFGGNALTNKLLMKQYESMEFSRMWGTCAAAMSVRTAWAIQQPTMRYLHLSLY
jgi:hypothetical protein